MGRYSRQRCTLAVAVVAAAVAVACSPAAARPNTSAAAVTTAAPVGEPDDRELRLGVLLPLTGAGSELGTSTHAAVELAVKLVNEEGGVNGRPIKLFVEDEGDDIDAASHSLDALLGRDVDAIVGPASSTIASLLLATTTKAGVLTCSPTASAMSLDDYPDEGLFFRTIASDSLQAAAIARAVERTGETEAGILYIGDAYGRPFAELVRRELARLSIEVVAVDSFDPTDTEFTEEAQSMLRRGARVVTIIGDASAGPRVVDAVVTETADQETPIVINDAMRVPTTVGAYERLDPSAFERITGVSPQSAIDNDAFARRFSAAYPDTRPLFATNAYDCVNLIALAANAAPSTQAAEIAVQISAVSAAGTPCILFASCDAGLRAGRNIDYDGPSAQLQIGTDGDPVRGVFDVFGFDGEGHDITLESVLVNA